ncbi:hypothetical protein [Spongiactinospora sp. 9N601]
MNQEDPSVITSTGDTRRRPTTTGIGIFVSGNHRLHRAICPGSRAT